MLPTTVIGQPVFQQNGSMDENGKIVSGIVFVKFSLGPCCSYTGRLQFVEDSDS